MRLRSKAAHVGVYGSRWKLETPEKAFYAPTTAATDGSRDMRRPDGIGGSFTDEADNTAEIDNYPSARTTV